MTTSITDARFTSLHFTPGHLLSLDFDDPPETGWGVMPGYDESLPIPASLEPPRLDADETLPSQLHPSYPFGRPPTIGRPAKPWAGGGVTNLLGTVGREGGSAAGSGHGAAGMAGGMGMGVGAGVGGGVGGLGGLGGAGAGEWLGGRWARGERWDEMGMRGVVEVERTKEVPPGMAGAKRPPSPPSPSLRPTQAPDPRSIHLQHLYARQRQSTPVIPQDPFDAPVPNETYAAEDGNEGQVGAGAGGGMGVEGVESEEEGEEMDEE